ncbi:MAG: XdhC family protein, partial [Acetivibrio ethanolgignens]
MRNMLNTMKDRLVAGEDLVLVTVIASSGATPRGAGARMLIGKQGRICGTIGGGAVEYRSEAIAKTVLENKSSYGHDFTLTKDDVQNLGMICGGTCNVFFHYIPTGDSSLIALAEEAERRFAKGEELWLISD